MSLLAGAVALAMTLQPAAAQSTANGAPHRIISLLAAGEPVFGIFAGQPMAEDADFILYSMERGPFDVEGMGSYLQGMRDAAGADALVDHPVLLRIPPIDGDEETARERVDRALETGIGGIVFPHVDDAGEAEASVRLLPNPWPASPDGRLVDVIIVEDRAGIDNVRDIVATPGLTVVFAGPGDLRRAYDGDMAAVEEAIQTVLAACKEFDVPCGVTAGSHDLAERLDQGFRVIIVTEPEALAVGREAAGR